MLVRIQPGLPNQYTILFEPISIVACMKTKQCSKCKQVKEASPKYFNRKAASPDGLSSWCKVCKRKADAERQSRPGTRKTMRARGKIRQDAARDYVWSILSKSECVDCGETNPLVLEFDHVRGEKLRGISYMIYSGYKLETIQDEIDKCEIRCANCHAIKTQEERKTHKFEFFKSLGKL